MKPSLRAVWLFASSTLGAGLGCNSAAPSASPPPIVADTTCVDSVIGPAGGALRHTTGAVVSIPAGALATGVHLTLCGVQPASSDALGGDALGQGFTAGPDGTTFLKPVDVAVPFDATRLATGTSTTSVQLRMAPQGSTSFVALQSTVDVAGGIVHALTTHFTQFVPASNPNPVFIATPPNLPDGVVGTAYVEPMAATGGTTPYLWSVASGTTLPPGLVLGATGSLEGTPRVPSPYAFFLAAADSAGHSVQQAFSMTVSAPSNPVPVLAAVSPSSALRGDPDTTVALTGTGFVPATQAAFDGVAIPTTFASATGLGASIPAVDLATAGTHAITVTSPGPGGGVSGAVTFTVEESADAGAGADADAGADAGADAEVGADAGAGTDADADAEADGGADATVADAGTDATAQDAGADATVDGAADSAPTDAGTPWVVQGGLTLLCGAQSLDTQPPFSGPFWAWTVDWSGTAYFETPPLPGQVDQSQDAFWSAGFASGSSGCSIGPGLTGGGASTTMRGPVYSSTGGHMAVSLEVAQDPQHSGWVGGKAFGWGTWIVVDGTGTQFLDTDGGLLFDSLVPVALAPSGRVAFYGSVPSKPASWIETTSTVGAFDPAENLVVLGQNTVSKLATGDGGAPWTQAVAGAGVLLINASGDVFTSDGQIVTRLDGQTGTVVWATAAPNASVAVDAVGAAYVLSAGGNQQQSITKIDANGALEWTAPLPQPQAQGAPSFFWNIGVDPAGDILVAGAAPTAFTYESSPVNLFNVQAGTIFMLRLAQPTSGSDAGSSGG